MPASQRANVLKSLSDVFFYGVLLEDFHEVDACDAHTDDDCEETLEEALDVYAGVKLNRYFGSRAGVGRSAAHRYLVFTLRDDEFMNSLRVTKPTFEHIWQLIQSNVRFQQRGKKPQRDVALQLAVALEWCGACGNGNSTARIVRHYGIGAGTVACYVRRVRQALLLHYTSYVSWPSAHQRAVTSAYHRERFGLPGVIGMGPMFALIKDHTLTDRCISTENSTVFAKSPAMQQPRRHFTGDEYLLGDSGYAVSKNIVTPYKKPAALKADNTALNGVVSSARVINENCIGLWKNRWMSLKGIRTQIKTKKDFTVVNNHILVCALLHNLGLSLSDVWSDDSNSDSENDEDEDHVDVHDTYDARDGCRKREQLKHEMLIGLN
ncbi:hypothetical protein PR003_g27408 [Phytophthora rubi]|uniref:DDE Tnp4 domain-containing protein n=1 Tax=Phytophthora rubi TaxID=129364 RepID=A0A6A3HSJ9_9STRA|nr:hypothetical protein PR002_g26851 [Phytophthora rubi]KAE9282432.1 hypothetical protein PR003_g27408 [Phytophthora rubi]